MSHPFFTYLANTTHCSITHRVQSVDCRAICHWETQLAKYGLYQAFHVGWEEKYPHNWLQFVHFNIPHIEEDHYYDGTALHEACKEGHLNRIMPLTSDSVKMVWTIVGGIFVWYPARLSGQVLVPKLNNIIVILLIYIFPIFTIYKMSQIPLKMNRLETPDSHDSDGPTYVRIRAL